MLTHDRRGQLFVVSAPSGVGKTTLIRAVLPHWPDMRFSVSSTTRSPRSGETPGEDYHFITRQEFESGIQRGRFLEWAVVHGELYGTDRDRVETWLQSGKDVLLEIDVQGASQVRCFYPRAHNIFILPPSMEALEERLQKRSTESPEQLARRLAAARLEIRESPWYDFIVINDSLEKAVADFDGILHACHCLQSYQAPRLRAFLLS